MSRSSSWKRPLGRLAGRGEQDSGTPSLADASLQLVDRRRASRFPPPPPPPDTRGASPEEPFRGAPPSHPHPPVKNVWAPPDRLLQSGFGWPTPATPNEYFVLMSKKKRNWKKPVVCVSVHSQTGMRRRVARPSRTKKRRRNIGGDAYIHSRAIPT